MKRHWLAKLLRLEAEPISRRYCVEPLERRELMAADLTDFLGSNFHQDTSSNAAFFTGQSAEVNTLDGEGEAGQDLVAFATLLRDAGVTMYGAAWNADTSEQLRLFQDGAGFIDFVDVTNPDRSPNSIATAEGITVYPTWKFQNNSTPQTGILTLQQLSTFSGIAIPTSSSPFLNTIPNQTVQINSPLHIPVDAYDPNANNLTVTVSSSNPSAVTAEVVQGGRSVRISTNFGDMVFRLFESESGRAAARFIQLAQSGFYNTTQTNNMIFHRVDDGFVIQGGDPTGTGSGGSNLGDFDDQFNVNLQHNRSGVLSFAKSSDDTNDSQFFITETSTQFLNANHSVFGQLVEGESVREAISGTAVNSSDRPTNPVIIQSVTVFDDFENGMLRLRAVGAAGSTSTITVTVTDTEGNSTSRTFTATAASKSANDPPFLSDFDDTLSTEVGQSASVQLSSQDSEGDAVTYFVVPRGSSDPQYTASVSTSGLLTVTPPTNYTGTFTVTVGVRAANGNSSSPTDLQQVSVTVTDNRPPAPTGIDLASSSDSGTNTSDNITNASSMVFTVSGTQVGATVELLRNGQVIASQVATGTTTSFTTTAVSSAGNGSSTITARQTLNSLTSLSSVGLTVVYDSTAPTAIPTTQFPTTALVGTPISLNLAHSEENSGLTYALTIAPAGATINATTGVVTWTPTSGQVGTRAFELVLTDTAGNTTTQNFTVDVSEPPLVSISLSFVDLNGNPINEIAVGQDFKLRITASDLRDANPDGVFSAFLDVLYNQNLIETVGTNPFTYLNSFNISQTGDITTAGVLNEVGAARSTVDLPPSSVAFVEVLMRAKAVGQATFTAEAADNTGSDVSLYSRDGAVPINQVVYNSASLAVGRSFDSINDSFNINEDSTNNSLAVLANDIIRSGTIANLTIVSVSTPTAGGNVVISGSSLLYTPAANYSGGETFTYTVRDANGTEDTATVTIVVNEVNDPPIAVADTFNVDVNSVNNVLTPLSNDSIGSDVGETLRIIAVGTTSNQGTVTINSSGTQLLYSPKAGFDGIETFTYTLSDGRGGTAVATISVNVGPQVPPPTAVSDSFTINEDAASTTYNVLGNDVPSVSGETLSIDSVTTSGGGTVSVTAGGGSITYRPAANFAGTEIVTYRLRGSNGGRTFGTVTFTVLPINDPPVANDDTINVLSDANQILDVLANDTNVDPGENLTISAISAIPANKGTVTISSDSKKLVYNPPSDDFEGTVTFTYTLSDGNGLTDTATVTLNVRNYTPRAIGGKITVPQTIGGSRVSGLKLIISGTATTGESISRQVTTDSTGSFQAANLPPGQYTVTLSPLAFRRGTTQVLNITSNPEDGDSLSNVLSVGEILPEYVNYRDFLGSAIGRGFSVAVDVGSTQQWMTMQGAWRGFKSVTATLNSAGTQMTVSATSNNNQVSTRTVNLSNNRFVLIREIQGTTRYIQVLGEPADLGLPTPSAADIAANTAGSESTQPTTATFASSTDLALQNFDGEGEGESDATFHDFLGSLDIFNNP